MPRAALMLFAHVTSAIYLLEHAFWSYTQGETSARDKEEHEVDVEVLVRWVEEFGLDKAVRDVELVWEFGSGKEREWKDSVVVFGSERAGEIGKARL